MVSPMLHPLQLVNSEEEQDLSIMLNVDRTAVMLIVTITKAYVVWPDMYNTFSQVGLDMPVYVKSVAFGSGYFVTLDSYIITNGHVVNDFKNDLEEKLPLLQELVLTFAEAYYKTTGEPPSDEMLQQLFELAIADYASNKLKLQDYDVEIYDGVGKVVTGIGNIGKFIQARIIDSSPFEEYDLALLKVDVDHYPSLLLSDVNKVDIGEKYG